MRMWNVNPRWMCRKHLLGEHVEMHMFYGTIQKGISIQGYLDRGLVETAKIKERHDALVVEMMRRGYHHRSPMPEFQVDVLGLVDSKNSIAELLHRCEECQQRYKDWYGLE